MNKPAIACTLITSLSITGCANMNAQQQQGTLVGAGSGAALGALIGGLTGNWQGALIGLASGALLGGLAGYALAPDPLTQSTAQTANEWQQTMAAQQETKATPVTLSTGETVNQIDQMKLSVPTDKMVTNGALSPNGEIAISKMIAKTRTNGGTVHISYPRNAPKAVVQKLLDTGVSVQKDDAIQDYVFVITRPNTGKVS